MQEYHELLNELALDLAWSWNHGGDKIWQQLDPELWEKTHNAWVILQNASKEKLDQVLTDPSFLNLMERFKAKKAEVAASSWFKEKYPNSPLSCIAYFSMEFMLSEALPIYSGGLGNVAGDQLKSASDLGVPVIGISLLYQQGYFRQLINAKGEQQALFPYNDPGQLPISPLRKPDGQWLRLEIPLSKQKIYVRTWEVKVGRAKLYLLDTNDAANTPTQRGITSELYGGDRELRLKQELLLGIGGWHLLEALGLNPQVCHLNEGHAAFAILERAKSFMKENGVSFDVALNATRAGNHFTTHTAVAAGFDYFSPELIHQYLGQYAEERLKIPFEKLLALGQHNGDDPEEYFNMANLAIRGSGTINGVSQLHAKVSRSLFQSLFPKFPVDEVPVESLTNGVHVRSWDSPMADELWTEACGKERWLGETEELEKKMRAVPDTKIWQMRNSARAALISYANRRLEKQLIARGLSPEEPLFDPNILTLGFARRFATYKRPNLLLSNPTRFLSILMNPSRPMQLLIAGKAHPADIPGQTLIKQWMEFITQNPEARKHVIFLSDYDMLLTEQMVQGVDVWVNTPRRPWEACGTSGMKVLVNGGINVSELDGWWAEAYRKEVGWAIGDGQEHGDDPAWDAKDANALYDLLEKEVAPLFYERDGNGIPAGWINHIRESMATLTPRFSTNRAVREYTERFYLPAANKYLERSKNQGALAQKITKWKEGLKEGWDKVCFGKLKVETKGQEHHFEVSVELAGLAPTAVRVELFANTKERIEMKAVGSGVYRAVVPTSLSASAYTPRILPSFPGVSVPLEIDYVHWQK
ncbi:MAG: alpha-glucan family phosphorylase [Verrucomicrobia bacterium]|nr:alpha-glucan family phosphorylase [Verrucomicrobiota bacterium]